MAMNRFAVALLVVFGYLLFLVDGENEATLRQPLKKVSSSSTVTQRTGVTMNQGRKNAGSAQMTLSDGQQPRQQGSNAVPGNAMGSSSTSQLKRSTVGGQSLAVPSSSLSSGRTRSSHVRTSHSVSSLSSSSASTLGQSQGQVDAQKSIGGLRGTEQQVLQSQTNAVSLPALSGEAIAQGQKSLATSRQRSDVNGETMTRSHVSQVSKSASGGSHTSLEEKVPSMMSSDPLPSKSLSTTSGLVESQQSVNSNFETGEDNTDERTFTALDADATRDQSNLSMEMTSPLDPPGPVIYPDHVPGYATAATSTEILPASSSTATESQGNEAPLPKHGKFNVEEDAAECKPLLPQEIPVSATWLSSYPGSGSKMVWRLIESVTGLSTGDDLDSNGQVANGVAVAVKTHYPSHATEDVFQQSKAQGVSRAILVLRNPMHAFPAYFRFHYFVEEKNIRESTSDQPPVDAWLAWIHENIDSEVKLWAEHVRWWMKNFKRENLHLLPYEYLSSPERGSDELQKVGNFLASVDPVVASNLLEPEKFCCVWEKMVDRDEVAASRARKTAVYSEGELEAMIQALIKLRDENKTFHAFFILMQEYLGDIVAEKLAVIETRTKQA